MEGTEERITYPVKQEDARPIGNNRLGSRKSNIELLRIICMVMIIAHHFCVHSAFAFDTQAFSFNRLWYEFLYTGGKIGVNVFILITGYFSFRNVTLKVGKLIQFYLQTFFYSIVIYLIFLIFSLPVGDGGAFTFDWRTLVDALLPVTSAQWWFVSGYFVILLISPFLNYFICSIPKNGLHIVIIIMAILYVVVPTFYIDTNFFTSNWDRNPVLWFIFLYLLGAYLGKYGFAFHFKPYVYFLIFFGICFLNFFSVVIFDQVGMNNAWFIEENRNKYLFEMQTIPLVLASIALFEGFLKIDIGSHKSINFISSLTFGVYLIHDNIYLRELLWKTFVRDTLFKEWLNAPNVETSPWFALISIGVILAVFIAGALIELFRMYVVEKLYSKPLKKLGKKIDDKIDNYIKKESATQ